MNSRSLIADVKVLAAGLWLAGALPAFAASNEVYLTNWVAAPEHWRLLSGRICDAQRAAGWEAVRVAIGTECSFDEPYPAPGQRGRFYAYPSPGLEIQVLNFRYEPQEFLVAEASAHPLRWRGSRAWLVFPLGGETNWLPGGRVGWVKLRYDYGLAVTQRVPVLVRKKGGR